MSKTSPPFRLVFAPIEGGPNWLMAVGIALHGPALLLLLGVFFPDERDPHGGIYLLILALPMLAVAVSCVAIGFLWRQVKRWRARGH